ncbi:MAG: IclR family transcriptional regulator [Polaromonas sp.]|nr:IclR family transcriptional regulator [Polaromonas sp.]
MTESNPSPLDDNAADSEQGAGPQPSGVKSALRVLQVLEFFATSSRPATLAQLSKQLELPKSSCFALLETMRSAGYMYWLGKDHGYYPTRRWRDLGEKISSKDPILALAAPTLAALRDELGETAILAKRDGIEVLYLDAVESTQVLRFSAHAGQRKPMHSAASGRAMLALLDPATRNALIAKFELQRYSTTTLIDPAEINVEVERGAARGWHLAVGEYRSDTTSIAAGFRFGGEEYAFVVGAPISRIADRHEQIGALLRSYAAAVSEA